MCVRSNEFSQMVAEEYLSNFNFSGLTIDQALRSVSPLLFILHLTFNFRLTEEELTVHTAAILFLHRAQLKKKNIASVGC